MLSFFTTAKPFRGHTDVIQRNALKSWTLLHPDIEIILFGDDDGSAEVAQELDIRHEPYVERNEFGTKRLDYMFAKAQAMARHDVLCYINCDIILMQDFRHALERVKTVHSRFLMVGCRWDTEIKGLIDFREPNIENRLRVLARETGTKRGPDCIDYFVFPRQQYRQIPPLVIGRIWWDHWLAWKAREEGADVVDVSECVATIHQNHDYGYHPAGAQGVWNDEQARRNYQLAGGRWHLHTIADATHRLGLYGERRNWKRVWAPGWRVLRPKCIPAWFAFLHATRPLRKYLGLRHAAPDRATTRTHPSAE